MGGGASVGLKNNSEAFAFEAKAGGFEALGFLG
jgi:hypothetical protein